MPLPPDWPMLNGDMGRDASPIRGVNRSFDQPAVMAAVLGSLFLAGGTIGALSLILPHPSEYDSSALWTNVGISYVFGFAVLLLRQAAAGLGAAALRPRRDGHRHARRLLRE